jgi:hypothetical protein
MPRCRPANAKDIMLYRKLKFWHFVGKHDPMSRGLSHCGSTTALQEPRVGKHDPMSRGLSLDI